MNTRGQADVPNGPIWRLAEGLLGADLAEEVLGDLLERSVAGGRTAGNLVLSYRALGLALSYRLHSLVARVPRRKGGRLVEVRTSKPQTLGLSDSTARGSFPMKIRTPASASSNALSSLHSIRLDVVQTLRSLGRTPALAAAVLLTLTLGIGATTAMYTVVRGVLLQPLPFSEPEKLLRVGRTAATIAHVDEFRALSSIETMTALGDDALVLNHEGTAVELRGLLVDGYHHRVFGVAPMQGRGFEPTDTLPGAEPVLILGHSTWVDYFGADREVIGRIVDISGLGVAQYTVVGVHGPDYNPSPWDADFLVPHRYQEGTHDWKDMARFWAIGRAAPNVSAEGVQTEARALVADVAAGGGVFNRHTADELEVVGLLEVHVGSIQRSLWLLLGVVGLVLLIGCANVANLILVRGMARRREFSLRQALGAGRARLARQTITEGLVLSLLGGALGVAFAVMALPVFLAALPEALPRAGEIVLDRNVLVFAGVVSMIVGLLFGLVPLFRISRGLRSSGARAGTQAKTSRRLNDLLVAGQLAMALVLLSSCGLLVRSMLELQQVDPGIEVQHLYSFRLSPPQDRYPEEERAGYFDLLEQAMQTVPGVTTTGAISNLPLTPAGMGVGISPNGQPVPASERAMMVSYRAISAGYLSTAGIPLLRGRNFTPADRTGSAPVGLVNRRLAERLWPDQNPVGRTISWGTGDPWFTVVGVIGDVHQKDLATETKEEAYVPYAQEAWVPGMFVLARTSGPGIISLALREALHSVDPMVPITDERTLTEVLETSMASASFNVLFFSCFAVLGVLLSAIGVYGVTLFVISQRTSEFGIRIALGADNGRLVMQVIRGNLPSVTLGIGVGLAMTWMVSRSLSALLFSVEATDPSTLTLAVLALGGGALVISALAARRVARLEPSSVLNSS